ncbi:MAG: NAD(P)-dependent oxidoreductase [Proteobacteria bacterium]|nr:NAD(P)-dependent oxidoreductase [Pseudomonadota bacterium]
MSAAATRVGILGFGRIGRAVAANLRPLGFAVATLDRPSTRDFDGPRRADAAQLAATSDVVVSALASEAQMEDAFLGPAGLVAGAHDGLVVIEMGTFPVALKQRLADALATRGAAMIDVPISGTAPVVARREAMLFVSGDDAAIARVATVLDGISTRQCRVGPFGAGMTTKLVANFLVIANTLALGEAMAMGTAAGLDPHKIVEAIGPSFAGSPVFSFRAPIMAERRYQPAPGPARIMWKDLQYIRAEAEAAGLPSPVLKTALEWYGRLIEQGHGEDESSSIFELLRKPPAS